MVFIFQPGSGEVCEHRAEDGQGAVGPVPRGAGYCQEGPRESTPLIPDAD
jgi:hypothetical protein